MGYRHLQSSSSGIRALRWPADRACSRGVTRSCRVRRRGGAGSGFGCAHPPLRTGSPAASRGRLVFRSLRPPVVKAWDVRGRKRSSPQPAAMRFRLVPKLLEDVLALLKWKAASAEWRRCIEDHTGGMQQDRQAALGRRRRERMLGWWYVCIGLGFILLGVRSFVRGDASWPIVLRLVIALGFLALGIGTLRTRARPGRRM